MGFDTVRPHCQPGQQTAYGASRNEAVTVRCAVDAHPATDLSFRWMFNSTLSVTEVPNSSISTSGWQSNVTHRVYQNEQQDYGTLLCWARNAIGEQRDPCIFSIQPAGLFVFYFYISFSIITKQNRSPPPPTHFPLLTSDILLYIVVSVVVTVVVGTFRRAFGTVQLHR